MFAIGPPALEALAPYAPTPLRLARPLARTTRTRNETETDFPIGGLLRRLIPLNLRFFPGCSLIFLDLFQVILCNKMKKYGLPGPKTSIIHEMLSFRCLMP